MEVETLEFIVKRKASWPRTRYGRRWTSQQRQPSEGWNVQRNSKFKLREPCRNEARSLWSREMISYVVVVAARPWGEAIGQLSAQQPGKAKQRRGRISAAPSPGHGPLSSLSTSRPSSVPAPLVQLHQAWAPCTRNRPSAIGRFIGETKCCLGAMGIASTAEPAAEFPMY